MAGNNERLAQNGAKVRRVRYALILIIALAFVGGFPAYLAMGQGGGSTKVTITVSAQPVYTPQGDGGEGGGGVAGGNGEDECPAGTVSTTGMVTDKGLAIQPIIIVSFDEQLYLTIDEGTSILTPEGTCPRCIGLYEVTTLPPPPEKARIIGVVYDAFPDGAIFDPPAILQFSYDPNDLPEGIVAEKNLVIAIYDQTSGQWIELDCVVDTEANTITAEVSQLYDAAVLGYEPVPTPAAFEVISLNISPTEVEIGETVNITVLVANTGGQPGSYQVTLKINSVSEAGGEVAGMTTSVVEGEREVVLDTSASEQVSFTTSKDTPGLYLVEVNGLTGSFEVKQPLSPVEPVNWWLIGGVIVGVAIVAFFIFLLRRMMIS